MATDSDGTATRRVRVDVRGTVQGVGFRPFVHGLAGSLNLAGHVRNDSRGVSVEVEGPPADVDLFLELLVSQAPPLAVVDRTVVRDMAPTGLRGFSIQASEAASGTPALIPPDVATCVDCLHEMFDPDDRRYRYPFINCTNCGPRFSIIKGVPYDRALTTMAGFEMCRACRTEYEDPADRRFHAQPNACAVCGPTARYLSTGGLIGRDEAPDPLALDGADAISMAAAALARGAILAVKGLGGFHLACLAEDEEAVARLRVRKHRQEKPFALMVSDLDMADGLIHLDADTSSLLSCRQRPIVLARRCDGMSLANGVAPGSRDLGIMLPYTPLHHLLLADSGAPLVMTSGNISDEPIAYQDADALRRLAGIADAFLLHDRPIHTRTEDSIARIVRVDGQRRPMMLRRSRGWVPAPLDLPVEADPTLLAMGAEMKSTFCVAAGSRAWIGPHIGDLRDWAALESYREGVEHLTSLLAVEPRTVVHDEHPEYLSSKEATGRPGVAVRAVQHHHAHMAACLAEYGLTGPAVGAIFDGAGWGADDSVWGGEIMVADLCRFRRVGHLFPVLLPGGDAAVREPWRMACSWLTAAYGKSPSVPERLAGVVDPARWKAVCDLTSSGLASPATTSVGRLFDAVAALCGIHATAAYEAQAAIGLEMIVDAAETAGYSFDLHDEDGMPLVIDPRPVVRAIERDLDSGVSPGRIAARFHSGLAAATAEACARCASTAGVARVVLSGGVFQNVVLLERTAELLVRRGCEVVVPRRVPPNDGGISYGQAAVESARQELARPPSTEVVRAPEDV